MAHVCYDCKLWYGHPLTWCPGCGRKMIKVKTGMDEFKAARAAGWKSEGDSGLYEYFLDGEPIDFQRWIDFAKYTSPAARKDHYYVLYAAAREKYPLIFDAFDAKFAPGQTTPKMIDWVHQDRELRIGLHTEDKKVKVTFDRPHITFRLVGSDLPVEPPPWNDELSLDKDRL